MACSLRRRQVSPLHGIYHQDKAMIPAHPNKAYRSPSAITAGFNKHVVPAPVFPSFEKAQYGNLGGNFPTFSLLVHEAVVPLLMYLEPGWQIGYQPCGL
jgi:hypothetical protein